MRRDKRLFTLADRDTLLHFLWAKDQFEFPHERYRLQLVFFIQLCTYTASRPGAINVSDAYRRSNKALTYKVKPPILACYTATYFL